MVEFFGVSPELLLGQIVLGLVNGAFFALLSLGLSIIFGMLDIVNFAHGTFYMVGAFVTWMLLAYFGLDYWAALILAPLIVAAFGILVERLLLARIRDLHHIYGFLLTFGLVLIVEGLFRLGFSASGRPYQVPALLDGVVNLGFMYLPIYRLWVVLISLCVCLLAWWAIEKTRFGSYLRAGIENPDLVQAFGINVSRMVTLTFGLGIGLAAFAGVLAAPLYPVTPTMGSDIIGIVFAVVIIGGLGSIMGSILGGFCIGVFEGLVKTFYAEASTMSIFVIMALVLVLKEGGLSGKGRQTQILQKI